MKKLSLHMQITILAGIILTLACLILTLNSIYSAKYHYHDMAVSLSQKQNSAITLSQIEDYSPNEKTPDIMPDQEIQIEQESYDIATQNFSIQTILVMLALLAVTILIIYWSTGMALRPLSNMTHTIKRINDENLHEQVSSQGSSRETRELTAAFNDMLKRLEASFAMQKQFAANAAHELKTPLSVLLTAIQVLDLNETPSAEDYEDFTEAVRNGAERLQKTLTGLTSLANQSAQWNEKISLKDLLNEVLSEFDSRKDITLSLNGENFFVNGDKNLLRQAFFNLIENAVKYNIKNGSVDVFLDSKERQVTIRDTGIGMTEAETEHIFEPFFRTDNSCSQKISGSGLGLSIVKEILNRHSGKIEIKSEPQEGTEITVCL